MNEKTTITATAANASCDSAYIVRKQRGNTTYIAPSRFNGDKRRNIATAFVRLVERDTSVITG
jgi:hypothetical protein